MPILTMTFTVKLRSGVDGPLWYAVWYVVGM